MKLQMKLTALAIFTILAGFAGWIFQPLITARHIRKGRVALANSMDIKSTLVGWLAAKGIALSNDCSDNEVLKGVEKAFQDHATAALTNSKESGDEKITALENEKTELAGKVTALENEKTKLGEKIVSFTKARAEQGADLAILKGKRTIAQRAEVITALSNDATYEAEFKKIMDSATVVRLNRWDQKDEKALANDTNSENTTDTYCQAVAKHMKDTGETDPIKAHKAVLKAMPALADALKPKDTADAAATGAKA
jgi:hypothetical protein